MNEWNKEIQNENELQVVISVSKAEELGNGWEYCSGW